MDSEKILDTVDKNGFCTFELDQTTLEQMKSLDLLHLDDGFYINQPNHENFLGSSPQINELLALVKSLTTKKAIKWNLINVVRVVKAKSSEKYRTHYDSHLYTLVIPLMIPKEETHMRGQLYLAPNDRKQPKIDFVNVIQKLMAFRFRGENGFKKLRDRGNLEVLDLRLGQAIIFNGSRSLHGNLANLSSATRITLITHMVDPFPTGFGFWLRKLRSTLGLRK